MSSSDRLGEFSLSKTRALVADLFEPNPWIYWADFLISVTVGYGCAVVYLTAPAFSPQQIVCFLIAGVLLYRVGSYMHEIVHFRREEMRTFRIVWNIVAGIPMLTPSFLYESHLAHHNTHHYGTGNDGEYLPLGVGRLRNVAYFLMQIAFLPAFVVSRFLFLTPLSFVSPAWRKWVLRRASSYVINFSHVREIPESAPRAAWAAMDIACSLRAWAMIVAVLVGFTDWTRLPMLYGIAVMTLGLNHLRTLVAHRYLSNGDRMSHVEQLTDSINISGGLLTEAVFPLGLRYHALHHLYPSLPYHNLYEAHRRLMARLPQDSPYHAITYPSFFSAFVDLVRNCREAAKNPPPLADQWYQRRREMLENQELEAAPEHRKAS